MKIGSLFSGIGGLELGLERSIPGAHIVWQVEQDEYARAVLAKHWPNATRYQDVREVGAHNLDPVDVICGGFPCQDISVAGKGAGLDGARSGLWTEYARIVRELRPGYVVVENVSALLNRGMGRVLGDLAACGYDAVWDCIPAADVGAPHKRDRLFVVAYTDHQTSSTVRRKRAPIAGENQSGRNHVRRSAGDAGRSRSVSGARYSQSRFKQHLRTFDAWTIEPQLGRLANGLSRRVDRLRCLGNAVVPQVAEVVGRVIMELDNADL